MKPEEALGEDAKLTPTLVKFLCSSAGEQVGYAFSVRNAIRFDTPTLRENDYLAEKLNSLISVTSDARNKYCLGKVDGKAAEIGLKAAAASAHKKAKELTEILEQTSKRVLPSVGAQK